MYVLLVYVVRVFVCKYVGINFDISNLKEILFCPTLIFTLNEYYTNSTIHWDANLDGIIEQVIFTDDVLMYSVCTILYAYIMDMCV